MYTKVDSSLDFVEREKKVSEFWQEKDVFHKQTELRKDGENFVFYDGPPTANGRPHIGHVLTRVIKDVIPRYHSMKGKNVFRKAGWDTHGLPVELEVERILGLDGKEQIEEYGIEPFIKKCKESVWKYKTEWEEMSERIGFWADMENPYITYENDYIESGWWALRQIWDKGLIYQGHKVVPYCPRCGTALSSHEVAQGYEDVTEPSVYVRFAVEDETDTYLTAWTTTPWTLPSNLALCVHPDEDYVLAEVGQDLDGTEKKVRYYVGASLVEQVLGEEYTIIEKMQGKDLVGIKYTPLFPYADEIVKKSKKEAFYVVMDNYVTLDEGTGIVHQAPAFGDDDARVGREYNLPFVQFINEDGTMPEEATDFAGLMFKEADPQIIENLQQRCLLIKIEENTHNYPFCWRCHTPLMYYARQSWFVKMTELRENLLDNNSTVNWIPPTIGTGRFGNFLENVIDWALSRERYWGTPLPVWRCEDCGYDHLVGSIAELKEMSDNCPEDIELHRPYIDQVTLNCPECEGEMHRVPEVIDGWFDSGSMPFAQYHYPFENQELFEETFPADFISEAVDQTRGWFYTLMAIGTAVFDSSPFKNCIVMGHVQDEEGRKMSKHLGNVVDPTDILDEEGADAVRWYFFTNSQPWLPSRFSAKMVNEVKRKFISGLWNTYAFYVLYADIDQFDPSKYELEYDKLSVMDHWILSRLNTLVKNVDQRMAKYDITGSTRIMEDFVDDLSNWYVRRSRERYWGSEMTQDKINAYMTLFTVLETLTRLSAPFVPFMTESMYQNLVVNFFDDARESVHLADFPTYNEDLIDPELEYQMKLVLELVNLGRAARNTSELKIRQPLSKMQIVSEQKLAAEYIPLVADELNVKQVEWVTDATELQDYQFKPQLRLLGPRFGKNLPEVNQKLAALDGRASYQAIQEKGQIEVEIAGSSEIFTEEDLLISTIQAEGLATASDHGVTVALDTVLTPTLIDEGNVREIVSKIQNMRRESGFEVSDRINLYYADNADLGQLMEKFRDLIQEEVLAIEVAPLKEGVAHVATVDINGKDLTLGMEVVG